jgi:multiple sugar transport system permease protein
MRKEWTAYLMQAPGLILFFVFVLFAVVFSFYLSFHRWDVLNPAKPYVGLDNYKALKDDPYFRKALYNTFLFTMFSVPLSIFGGLAIAILLNREIHMRGVFRTFFYLPVVTPLVVSGIIWKWVFNGDFGLLNYYLQKLHIVNHDVLWLSDPDLALPAVTVVLIWGSVGFCMLVYLAGLQSIPSEYYEAAAIDGAGPWNTFRAITLPLLGPTTFFLFVVNIIGAFQVFDQVYVMTSGGPLRSTSTIVYLIWTNGFTLFQMGYAAAIAYVLFGIIFVFTLIQVRLWNREADY